MSALLTGCLLQKDYGESQSHQYCNDGRYRRQRDGQVEGHHGHRTEQGAVRLHCELPRHPLQSAAEGWLPVPTQNKSQGNTGRPQVS